MTKLSSLLTAAALALPFCARADVHAYVGLPLTATQEQTAPNSVGRGNVTVLYDTATKALYTGHIGDGKIFVYNVAKVVKVRTGEQDYAALQDVE